MKAYLNFRHSDEEAAHFDKIGFGAKITNAYELENGFIAVIVDWDSKIDRHKIKHAQEGCIIYSSEKEVAIELEFQNYSFKYDDLEDDVPPRITVLLDYKGSEKRMDYVCFQNLKYQAAVYFAPQDWNYSKNPKKIDF